MSENALSTQDSNPNILAKAIRTDLAKIAAKSTKMRASGRYSFQAESVEDLEKATSVGVVILDGLITAIDADHTDDALERTSAFTALVEDSLAVDRLLDDIPAVVTEAETEREKLQGGERRAMTLFIQAIEAARDQLKTLPHRATILFYEVQAWVAWNKERESQMAKDKAKDGITSALQTISRQISFIGTNMGSPSTGGTAGAGKFGSVSEQLMTSLDTLALPHHGVEFSSASNARAASDTLIEGLLDAFRPSTRAGTTVFEPGRTEGRASVVTTPAQLLGGAARVAARQVRDEANIILDILDRLPDMTRFETRTGVPKIHTTRDKVARHFDDLDEVMADPIGINLPRARSTIRRAVKATGDFFDYANLEQEFAAEMKKRKLEDLLSGEPVPIDDDETGIRRAVIKAEEIRAEIREVCDAYVRLRDDVERPLDDTLGRTAARLELQLAAIYRSALDMRTIFVRHGTNLPEQDILFFTDELRVKIDTSSQHDRTTKGRKLEMSVGQLLDWIIEVSKPHADASHLIGALEALDLTILCEELANQCKSIGDLILQADKLGYALRLAGPMRQLEELRALLGAAVKSADTLATTTSTKEG